jgi:glycerophosphoryl diester phosphodiesterase
MILKRIGSSLAAILLCLSVQADIVISHKTAGLEYPENTLEGFKASLNMPVDAIELDLHVTRDKQIILHHDPVLSSYNCFPEHDKQRLIIAQSLLADLTALNCRNHKVDRDYRLPTFRQILEEYETSDQSKALYIEIKVWDELIENNPLHRELLISDMHYSDEEVAALVLAEIRRFNLAGDIVFNSFSRNLLLTLKDHEEPEENFQYGLLYKGEYAPWTLGLIALLTPLECYDSCWKPNYKEVSGWMKKHDIDYLIPNFAQLNNILFRWSYRRHIDKKDHNFDVIPWTLNTDKSWREYHNYHFDGIITDLPTHYLSE